MTLVAVPAGTAPLRRVNARLAYMSASSARKRPYGPSESAPPCMVSTAVPANSVMVGPGWTTTTLTPNGATSSRSESLIASTACLLAW